MNHSALQVRRLLWLFVLFLSLLFLTNLTSQTTQAQGGTVPPSSLTKSDQGVTVIPGALLTYKIGYSNPTDKTLLGVTLTDSVPPNTTFVAASSPGWSCDGNSLCTYMLGDLDPEEQGVVDFVVQVNATIQAGVEELVNTAQMNTAADGVVALATETTPVTAVPDLFVSKNDKVNQVTPGSVLKYTITYGNRGNQDAAGVILTEVVPTGTKFLKSQSSAGWSCIPSNGNAGATCTLAIANVPAGTQNAQTTFAVTVDNPVAAGVNRIRNSVTIAYNQAGGPDATPTDNSAQDSTVVNAAPDLVVTKSDSADPVSPGDLIIYTITFRNSGNQTAKNIRLFEQPPPNTEYVSTSSSPGWVFEASNNRYRFNRGTLVVNQDVVVTFAVRVNQTLPAGVTTLQNTVTINDDGRNGADPVPANNSDSETTAVNATPDLAISKSDADFVAEPGDTIVYTLNYRNNGGRTATGVQLQETVPANTTFAPSVSAPGWSCLPNNNANSTCTLALGTVNGGQGGSVTFAVVVNSLLSPQVLQINNTVTINDDGSGGADSNPSDNSATQSTPIAGATSLNLAKTDDGITVPPGGSIQYTLNYANFDTLPVAGVRITETVPANTTFTGPAAAWSCPVGSPAGTQCIHTVGDLANGATGAVLFSVQLIGQLPDDALNIVNVALLGSNTLPNADTGDEITPIGGAPDLTVSKSDGGVTALPGDLLTYQLNYGNSGNRVATLVRITETVPANTSFNAAASTPGWVCQGGGAANSRCTLTIDRLPAGGAPGSALFAVTVAPTLPAGTARLVNVVQITDDGTHNPDTAPLNNSAVVTTPVTAAPDLQLNKDDGDITIEQGKTVVYTLNYSNIGNEGATGVVITETVPAETEFNADLSTEGWDCTPDGTAGNSCTLEVGVLGAGESDTVNFAVTVNRPIADETTAINNTATVGDDGTNGPDPNLANNSDSESTPVQAAPIDLSKNDGGIAVDVGETIEYLLIYVNHLPQVATAVRITETVPENTRFVGPADWSCPANAPAGTICTYTVGDLSSGQNGSIDFVVQVNATVPAGTTEIVNQAAIGSALLPNIDLSIERTPLKTLPLLTLSKSDNDFIADAGSTIGYVLSYANSGDLPASGVIISETVPLHTVFAGPAGTWSCAVGAPAGTLCTHAVGDLPGKSNGSLTFAVTVAEQVPAGVAQISNTALIGSGSDPAAAQGSDATPLIAAPDLSLSKSDGGATVRPGDLVVYELSYENQGGQAATNVLLTEQIPSNTTFDSASSTLGWSCTGATCTFALSEVAAGSGGSVDFAVRVNENLPANVTAISNTASITDDAANGPDPNPLDNTASDSTPLVNNLVLVATKQYTLTQDTNGDGEVNPDDVILYTIVIANQSANSATGVVFKDTFDPNTRLAADNAVEANAGAVVISGNSTSDTSVQVFLGTLGPNQSRTIRFPVKINNPLPAGLNFVENQGIIESNGNPSIATDDPAVPGVNNRTRTPVIADATLRVTKADLVAQDVDGDGLIEPGDRLLYRIRIVNNGNIVLNNITVTDTPDANTTLVTGSVKTSRGTISGGNSTGNTTVSVAIDQLLPGTSQRAEISFEVVIKADIEVNAVYNQAMVQYNKDGTPLIVLSDDPKTPDLPNDATATAVILPAATPTPGLLYLPLIQR